MPFPAGKISTREAAMTAFRILLAILTAALAAYTAVVVARHGLNLFPQFFGDIAAMGWAGQFNADFTTLLTLSGLWMAWRNHFTPAGIALGVLGLFGGGPLLMSYLLILSYAARGDMKIVLGGRRRAAA